MTYAYWYLFAVMLLPYCFAFLAKFKNPHFSQYAPHDFMDNLEGWRKRSHWAQMNSFDIFPAFAAAVIIAHQVGAPQQSIDIIALVFLILRVMYGFFYILNQVSLSSLTWLGSLVCIVSLFIISR